MRVDIFGSGYTKVFDYSTSGSMVFPYGVGLAFLFSDSYKKSYTQGKKLLEEGPLDSNGERYCRHLKISGSAVAVPRDVSFVTQESIKIYANYDFSVPMSITHLRLNRGYWVRIMGPVFNWDTFSGYTRTFPDQLSPSGTQNRNMSFTAKKESKDSVRTVMSGEWSHDGKTWTTVTTDNLFEFRNGQFYQNSGGPYNMRSLQASSINDTFTPTALNSSWNSLQRVIDILDREFVPDQVDSIYGDLVRRCANDTRTIPTNSIELVMEIRTIAETLRAAYGLTKGKIDAKKLASGYLQYKYGLRLTAMDLTTVAKGLMKRISETKPGYSRSRAMDVTHPARKASSAALSNCEIRYNYKIHYALHSNDWRDGLRTWFDTGLFPSLTNAWDLIPLSFVLDWFFKVESYLDAVDANTYWSLHDITGVVYTEKRTYNDIVWIFNTDPNYTLTGDLSIVSYNRQVSSVVHAPLYFDPSPRYFKNYAELTALIVANR